MLSEVNLTKPYESPYVAFSRDDGYAQSTMAPLPILCEHVLWPSLDPLNLIETRAPRINSGQFDIKIDLHSNPLKMSLLHIQIFDS